MHSFLFNRLRPCPYHTGIPAKGQKPNFSEKGELNPILTRFPNLLFQTKPVVPPRILANAGCFRDGGPVLCIGAQICCFAVSHNAIWFSIRARCVAVTPESDWRTVATVAFTRLMFALVYI